MDRPPLFVELCAGLASVSLVLQHGRYCKPPVSRMGNKFGYSLAVLRVMGLRPGQRADSFLLAEPDPGCRALLTAYTDPALMREAANIIRGWKDEDPRELWERLRAEGPIRDFGAGEVARWRFVWSKNLGNKPVPFDAMYFDSDESRAARGCYSGTVSREALADRLDGHAEASELARYLQVAASNRLINIDSTTMQNSGQGGTTFGGDEFATPAETVADAAREVARWATVQRWSMLAKDAGSFGANNFGTTETSARSMDRIAGLPATIVPDCRGTLLDVLPQSPLPDVIDRYRLDPESLRKVASRGVRAADEAHGVLIELCASMTFAGLMRAVPPLVGHVLPLRAPDEVVGRIVVPAAVDVANNAARGPRAVERLTDQRSDAAMNPRAGSAEDQLPIPVLAHAALEWAIRVDAADLALAGDLVFRCFENGFPVGHDSTPIVPTVPYAGDLPKGTVCFMDGPYENTTGYGHAFPRAEQVKVIRRWAEAGAACYVSEAEPIPELVADGWHTVEITSTRVGQRRTFSKQQREWLTCSVEPAWRPAVQRSLFG